MSHNGRQWIVHPGFEHEDTLGLRPGFYRMRLVKDGPFVPVLAAVIEDRCPETGDLMDDVRYVLEIDGRPVPNWQDRYRDGLGGEEITEAEFNFMRARADHARTFNPDHPAANPTRAIDISRMAPPF